jgi:hypothetical protein
LDRLKSAIWVSGLLRRCQAQGLFGAVIRKGAEEAGAVFVIVNHLDGSFHLLGPAPGPSIDEAGDRRWILEAVPPAGQAEIDAILDKRRRVDSDIWVVEIEDRTGLAGLEVIRM